MNILVTGGAGGIGSTLCLYLTQRGHNVIAYDNLNNGYRENLLEDGEQFCTLYKQDIRNTSYLRSLLKTHRIDYIIHLAAITALPVCESDPAECINVNVAGTISVLDAARERGVPCIVAGTSAIYENNSYKEAPFTEDIYVYPRLFYPLSKKMMEDAIESYRKNYDMNITVLRFFNVFGPRQDIHRKSPPLINYIVRQIHNNDNLVFYSNGKQVRDYVHVDDVVDLIELCLTNRNAANQTFNVCTETLTSVRDIIGYAAKAFNKSFVYEFKESTSFWSDYSKIHEGEKHILPSVLNHEVNKYALGSFKKASDMLGWKPRTDIENLMIDTMRKVKL